MARKSASSANQPVIARRTGGFVESPGSNPPQFAVNGTLSFDNFPGTTTPVNIPAGRSGDYAVINFNGVVAGTAPTTPAGWALILSKLNSTGGGTVRGNLYGRRLDGSEGAAINIVVPGGETTIGVCSVFSGVNLATPFTLIGAGTNLGSPGASVSIFNPPDGAVAAGATFLCYVDVTAANAFVISTGTGLTEFVDMHTFNGAVFHRSIGGGLFRSAAGGVIDPGTFTYDGTATGYGVTLDLQLNP